MTSTYTPLLLKSCSSSRQKRIHGNSLLLISRDELKELDQNHRVKYDPLLENCRLSVLLTDRLIQTVHCCHYEQLQRKTIVLQKNYPNESISQISARLEDCKKSMSTRVTKKLERNYPSEVVKCAMSVYNYQNNMNSKVTYNILYRKLQEAIFRHQGTVEERLLIQTKANFRSQIEAQIQREISNGELEGLLDSHTDCMDIIAQYRLSEDQLNKLSIAESYEYMRRKNQLIDSRIENRLRQIADKPSKVSRKDSFFFDCFVDEFSKSIKDKQEEQGKLRTKYSLKYIEKSYGIDNDNKHLLSKDIREENLRILALRPDLPVYFDRIGRAHLRRTEI